MRHYTEEELAWYALDADLCPEPMAIAAHVRECSECAKQLALVLSIDIALAERATWQEPTNLLDTPPSDREALLGRARRIAAEVSSAQTLLAPLINEPLAFVWADIISRQQYQTAGAVRVLCDAANTTCERNALHALNLADAALAIATSLPAEDDRYTNVLVGLAWKERANALRYLGRFLPALDATENAERAYRRAPATEWERATVRYVRGVILFESDHLNDAQRCAEDAARVFAAYGDTMRYLWARTLEASVRYWRHDLTGARDLYLVLLQHAEANDDAVLCARLAGNAGNCLLDLGDVTNATVYLVRALTTYEERGMQTEASRIRWALARLPLIEGHLTDAIARLRESKAECEALGLTNDAALITLDLAEALLATGRGFAEVRRLCAELLVTFRNGDRLNQALTALAYLREGAARKTLTPPAVRHVRRFMERLQQQPELLFTPARFE